MSEYMPIFIIITSIIIICVSFYIYIIKSNCTIQDLEADLRSDVNDIHNLQSSLTDNRNVISQLQHTIAKLQTERDYAQTPVLTADTHVYAFSDTYDSAYDSPYFFNGGVSVRSSNVAHHVWAVNGNSENKSIWACAYCDKPNALSEYSCTACGAPRHKNIQCNTAWSW